MIRTVFITLMLTFSALAQNPGTKPELTHALGAATQKQIQAALDQLFVRLRSEPAARGYLVNFGTNAEIIAREDQLKKAFIPFWDFDLPRLIVVRGGFRPKLATEMWYLPPGSGPPEIDSGYRLLIALDDVMQEASAIADLMMVELAKDPGSTVYFDSTGTKARIARRKAAIVRAAAFRKYDLSRVVFRAHYTKRNIGTEIWISSSRPVVPPAPAARMLEKFGQVSDTFIRSITLRLLDELGQISGSEGVFLIRGNKDEVADFEKRIRNVENFSQGIPANVRIITRTERCDQTTVSVWIVPPGATLPERK